MATAEVLDGVRRGLFGNPQSVCVRAQRAVEELTGTETFSAFGGWLAARRQGA